MTMIEGTPIAAAAGAGGAYTFADLYKAVGRIVYNTNSPSGDDLTECKRIVNEAYLGFLGLRDWSFLTPAATITLWTDIAVAAAVTVACSLTTMTATGGTPFYSSMAGATITVTGIGTRTVVSYTSSTVLTIDTTFATSHTFSFTANGTYGLPDDFGTLVDRFTWPDGAPYAPLKWRTAEYIRNQRAIETGSCGDPIYAALSPRPWVNTLGQRWNLEVWPTPSQNRVLHYRYRRNPESMTSDTEYPWGGPRIAPAILAAVKAAAEQEKNRVRGPHTEQYEKINLPAALEMDIGQGPTILGPTIGPQGETEDVTPQVGTLTHNGVAY